MKKRIIYNRIGLLRREKGLSRQALADLIGVNFQTVGYLERQEYNPSLDLAFRVCDVFALPVETVFSPTPFQSIDELLRENGEEKK